MTRGRTMCWTVPCMSNQVCAARTSALQVAREREMMVQSYLNSLVLEFVEVCRSNHLDGWNTQCPSCARLLYWSTTNLEQNAYRRRRIRRVLLFIACTVTTLAD